MACEERAPTGHHNAPRPGIGNAAPVGPRLRSRRAWKGTQCARFTTASSWSLCVAPLLDHHGASLYRGAYREPPPAQPASSSHVSSVFAATSTDCDDSSALAYPGGLEIVADGVDQDCDGVDACYTDVDGDGYGTAVVIAGSSLDCATGTGATVDTDCDDGDAAVSPAGAETCNGVDDDCDGLTDDGSATDASTWYVDADGDGHGGSTTTTACTAPSGAVATSTDCDDSSALVYPGGPEIVADSVDQDCDGVDACYADADGDGYGTTAVVDGSSLDCSGGTGASLSTDCDDAAASVHPGASEIVADGADQDCDGVDACYSDDDDDGYGTAVVVDGSSLDCASGTGAMVSTDCDDGDPAIRPGAVELPGDEVDQDCDGTESCYVDADEDGARTAFLVASSDTDCRDPGEGLASADLDCDDADPGAWPGATELVGDEVDQDCDGGELCYVDLDGDGYVADSSTVVSADADCADSGEAPGTALDGDCDDLDAAYNPGASESDCTDPEHYNCDGSVAWVDADGDGYAACEECDDGDAAVYPGAAEAVGDGVDGDCDGTETCFVDGDGDGSRADGGATVASVDLDCADPGEATEAQAEGDCDDGDGDAAYHPGADESDCTDPADYNCDLSSGSTDADGDGFSACEECDDGESAVNPDADELCNGLNDDCDGAVDVDAVDAVTWFADADADGYTASDDWTEACDPPEGYAAATDPADCDDGDASIFPGAEEVPDDGIDEDCDGADARSDDSGSPDVASDGGKDEGGSCGCASGGPTGAAWWALLALAGAVRRRSVSPRGL